MKDMLLKKKEELEASIKNLEQQFAQLQEQIVMQRGAYYYNDMLLKELDAAEQAKAAPALEAVKSE